MQDRYVGDVGDYGKYSLLDALLCASNPKTRLGIIWYLFPDESHNDDGGQLSYLDQRHMAVLAPRIHEKLRGIVRNGQRSVCAVEDAQVLPPATVCVRDYVTPPDWRTYTPAQRREWRAAWFDAALAATRDASLVFLDPDNGLATKTVERGAPKAGKYVFWDELKPFTDRGQSLVVYHHLNRTAPVPTQVERLHEQLAETVPGVARIVPMVFRRGSCRVFWILAQHPLAEQLDEILERFLDTGWDRHFDRPPHLRRTTPLL
jgi:hypothetical protein